MIGLSSPETGQRVFVATLGSDFIGFICLLENYSNEYLLLDNLHVSAKAQGKGIGKKLIYYALNSLNLENDKGLSLEVLKANNKAIGFYTSLGGIQIHSQIWLAPCGTKVEEYVYQWPSIEILKCRLKGQG